MHIGHMRKEIEMGSSLHEVVFHSITIFLNASGVVHLSVSNGAGVSKSTCTTCTGDLS